MKWTLLTWILLTGQQLPIPEALPTGQIATAGGGAQAAPITPPQSQTGNLGQLPAVQIADQQRTGVAPFNIQIEQAVALRPLLTAIAQDSGLNLVMAAGVEEGTFAGDLREVNMAEALDIILTPRNLEYRIDGNLLRVLEREMETRTIQFDYITTQRTLSRSLSATGAAGGGSIAGAGGGGGGGGSTSISGTEQTNLLQDIEADVQELISGTEGSRVIFNQMAGLIIATDYREYLDVIQSYLEQVQNAVHRQVIIETRIVEVKLNEEFQAGIDWTAALGNTGIISQSFGAAQGGFNWTASHESFTSLLQALSQQGNVDVLQQAQLSTMNNQPAVFRVGTQDVFFTTTTQVDPRTGTIIQTSETPASINEGVVLDVTPQISSDGIITMNIHPTITERTGQRTSATGNTVPITDVRETDIVARVADGGTVVLAGLISDRMIENTSKIPVLGDIPLLGGLFTRKELDSRKSDTVILVTPRIITVQSAAEFARERIEEQERLRRQLN